MSETNNENISKTPSSATRTPRAPRGGARGARVPRGAAAHRGGATRARRAAAVQQPVQQPVQAEQVEQKEQETTATVTAAAADTADARQTVQPVREAHAEQRNEEREEKQVRPSRTIWVQSQSKEVDSRVFSELVQRGLTIRQEHNKGYFLTWDSLENASTGYTLLREAGYSPRYKFYKLYFTMTGLNGSEDYGTLKGEFTSHLESTSSIKVQFCKFYRKDGKFIGGGDLSLDTVDGYNDLLSSKSVHKNYKFGNYSGTFYKFNSKNDRTQQPRRAHH